MFRNRASVGHNFPGDFPRLLGQIWIWRILEVSLTSLSSLLLRQFPGSHCRVPAYTLPVLWPTWVRVRQGARGGVSGLQACLGPRHMIAMIKRLAADISVADNNLLCLINFALATSAVFRVAAALKTPSDENHVFDLVNVFLWGFFF